jgi:uncharacterized damage-inducible protein DinB
MDLAQLFIDRSRHYLQHEYRTKIREAVVSLPSDAIWWRPNAQSNSVGNLLLHLAGNVRQWIVSGVGGQPDARIRPAEFAATSGLGAAELLTRLEGVLDETDRVLAGLSATDLASRRTIQGREMTVAEAVYHVVEHFSMHLGQIIYVAKLQVPGAVRFYDDDPSGRARPLWEGGEDFSAQ